MSEGTQTTPPPGKFDQWCILEIMGHQRYAGRVTEETVAGNSFIRIDIPAVDSRPAFTKLFSASSVYAITPVVEDIARGVACELRNEPIGVYDLPKEMRAKLQAPSPTPLLDYGDEDQDLDPLDDDDEEHF